MNRRSRFPRVCHFETLEIRTLLAVKVTLTGNGVLKIRGTGDADEIGIDGMGGVIGGVEVFVNNVRVNEFAGVRTINANLKDGDDQFSISAVQILGDVIGKFGDGADKLDIDGNVDKRPGLDANTQILGSVKASFGGDAGDIADFDDGVRIGGNVTFSRVADVDVDGDGSNSTDEAGDIDVRGSFLIDFSGQGDHNGDNLEGDFDDLNVFGIFAIHGSGGIERIEITSGRFAGNFEAEMDDGNDVVDIDNGLALKNEFLANALFDGGDDNDTLLRGVDNLFALPEVVDDFETVI